MTSLPALQIKSAVRAALDEDLRSGDVTTDALFPESIRARGTILARESMIVAGVAVAHQVFGELDTSLHITTGLQDGARADAGSVVLTVEGDTRSILMAERVALNFLQHLSGIATLTSRFVEATRTYGTKILDTRKTTPGLRALEKWAVRLGGGHNHRHSLGDGVLIKDNHLAVLQGQGIGVAAACRLARQRGPHGQRLIVEVGSLTEIQEALDGGADVILMDNMDAHTVRRAVELVKGRALVEVSGGVTLANVVDMAATGADAISIGALTHSAPAANLSMDVVPLQPTQQAPRSPEG